MKDVLRHRQVFHQVQFLVDDGNAQRLRVARVVDLYGFAVEKDLARVHLVDAGEHLHHRRFSRAVLADQRVHLAALELKVAVVQRVNARKVLLYPRICSRTSPIPRAPHSLQQITKH